MSSGEVSLAQDFVTRRDEAVYRWGRRLECRVERGQGTGHGPNELGIDDWPDRATPNQSIAASSLTDLIFPSALSR